MIERAKKEIVEKIIKKIKKSETKDDKVVKAVDEIKKTGIKVLRKDKLILKKGKVYVPKNENWRLEIICLYYNILITKYEE